MRLVKRAGGLNEIQSKRHTIWNMANNRSFIYYMGGIIFGDIILTFYNYGFKMDNVMKYLDGIKPKGDYAKCKYRFDLPERIKTQNIDGQLLRFYDGTPYAFTGKLFNEFCIKILRPSAKHIPVYEPMTKKRILHLMATSEDISGVKWIDGQPYELITLNRSKD